MKVTKTLTQLSGAAALAVALATAPMVFAQSSTTTTAVSTTTSAGTVQTFDPTASTIAITTDTSTDPIAYSYSKETVIVDSAGNPVEAAMVKSGVPVSVHYVEKAGKKVVDRIVVTKTETTEVTEAPAVVEESKSSTTTTTTTEE